MGSGSALPFARDLEVMGDTDLHKYLDGARLPNGDMEVVVKDPDNITDSFVERLRKLHHERKTGSRPVDLDEVSARLANPQLKGDYCIIPSSPSTPSLDDIRETSIRLETEAYDSLLADGGRPLYPKELLPDVWEQPADFEDLLRPWAMHRDEMLVFEYQNVSWKGFREYQAKRRSDLKDGAFKRRTARIQSRLATNPLVLWPGPTELDTDASAQDQLTTWIEYVYYLYYVQNHGYLGGDRERKEECVRWAVEQIPVIESETRRAAKTQPVLELEATKTDVRAETSKAIGTQCHTSSTLEANITGSKKRGREDEDDKDEAANRTGDKHGTKRRPAKRHRVSGPLAPGTPSAQVRTGDSETARLEDAAENDSCGEPTVTHGEVAPGKPEASCPTTAVISTAIATSCNEALAPGIAETRKQENTSKTVDLTE